MSAQHHIVVGLSKIGLFLRSAAWQQAEVSGLTPTQAQILSLLAARGPARVGTVAAETGVTQPTASDAIAALRRKGYVERRRDPQDGRAARLHLTEVGRRAAVAEALWPDALSAAIDDLDAAEQAALLRVLSKMIRSLQVRRAIPLQRMCVTCSYFRPYAHADAALPHHCAFVDAAFGDAALRLDCSDHVAADATRQRDSWQRFDKAPA
jgi:DNA-binding MarR family transcriptional regulator